MTGSMVQGPPEPVQIAEASLGEAPAWDEERQLLLWVDITNGVIHQLDPATGHDDPLYVADRVSSVVPWRARSVGATIGSDFATVDVVTGAASVVASTGAGAGFRFNDAKCDPQGRYLGGTIALDLAPGAGSLHRLDGMGRATALVGDLSVSNGLAWDPSGRTMYLIDSFAYGVYAFDYDVEEGLPANRRRFIDLPEADGLGDGMTVDSAGGIWVALFGGGAVRRYLPDGELDLVLELPVTHPTSCAFGGPDCRDLYITSARQDVNGPMSESRLRQQPLAGSVFRVRLDVPGLPTSRLVLPDATAWLTDA